MEEMVTDYKFLNEEKSQFFFLSDKIVGISNFSVIQKNYDDVNIQINRNRIRPYEIGEYKHQFTFDEDAFGKKKLWVNFLNSNSILCKYLKATSMIHWRKILDGMRKNINPDYTQKDIECVLCSSFLTDEEINEQVDSFYTKMYYIGYLLCKHKDHNHNYGVCLVNNRICNNSYSTGKSLFVEFVKILVKAFFVDGRSKFYNNPFIYEGVNKDTDLILYDDIPNTTRLKSLNQKINGDLFISKKYKAPSVIRWDDSPKIIATMVRVPNKIDLKIKRQWKFITFSDWFHKGNNEEEYTPKMMFGKILFEEFSQKDWSETISFLLGCVGYYMACNECNEIPECAL